MNARVRALAVLLAVFLLGCSVGFFSYHLVRSKMPSSGIGLFGPTGVAGNRTTPGRERGGLRLQQQLQLSPSQQAQFESILKEFRPKFEAVRAEEEKRLEPIRAEINPKFEAVRAEMAPKFDAIRSEMNRRIAGILNEDQKTKFETLQKGREGPPGPGRPGGARRRPDRPGPPPKGPRQAVP